MTTRHLRLITGCSVVLLAIWLWPAGALRHPYGWQTAPNEPVHAETPAQNKWKRGEYTITPLADFHVQALVLSKAHYRFDREAELASYDLALGWGPMSDQAVIDTLDITQNSRWYYYRFTDKPCPISKEEVDHHSKNMHLIAADDGVLATLGKVRVGQLVRIKGYLVRADAPDGWHWVSSLARNDTGAGSCDLVWVREVEAFNP